MFKYFAGNSFLHSNGFFLLPLLNIFKKEQFFSFFLQFYIFSFLFLSINFIFFSFFKGRKKKKEIKSSVIYSFIYSFSAFFFFFAEFFLSLSSFSFSHCWASAISTIDFFFFQILFFYINFIFLSKYFWSVFFLSFFHLIRPLTLPSFVFLYSRTFFSPLFVFLSIYHNFRFLSQYFLCIPYLYLSYSAPTAILISSSPLYFSLLTPQTHLHHPQLFEQQPCRLVIHWHLNSTQHHVNSYYLSINLFLVFHYQL